MTQAAHLYLLWKGEQSWKPGFSTIWSFIVKYFCMKSSSVASDPMIPSFLMKLKLSWTNVSWFAQHRWTMSRKEPPFSRGNFLDSLNPCRPPKADMIQSLSWRWGWDTSSTLSGAWFEFLLLLWWLVRCRFLGGMATTIGLQGRQSGKEPEKHSEVTFHKGNSAMATRLTYPTLAIFQC